MTATAPGLFVSVEGMDGAGKTTHARLLAEALREDGQAVTEVREPGTTALGLRIRELLLQVSAERPPVPWAEAALFLAARAQVMAEVVAPALLSGELVLADRYIDSSLAYQGTARGLTQEAVLQLHRVAGLERLPDLTLLLDLDPAKAAQRRERNRAGDRLEFEPTPYHEAVRQGYLELADRFSERVLVLDATKAPAELVEQSLTRVRFELAKRRSE